MRIAILSLMLFTLLGAAAKHSVDIKGMKFSPAALTVKTGDTVTWTNSDDRDHTVNAGDKSFSSGKLGPGETFSFTFKKAGKFAYSCSYHPRMKATITVQD